MASYAPRFSTPKATSIAWQGITQEKPLLLPTEQAVIMLAGHLYESRDGSTAGCFGDNVQAMETTNMLLRLERSWSVG